MTTVAPGAEVAPGLVLRERLSRGVLGETWRAERGLQPVAVKLTADPQGALLLERECRLGETLAHPRLVTWGGFMVHADGLALAQAPFLPGGDARALAARTPAEALGALAEVADALAHLHARGIVHRDLKPANVLLDAEGRPHLIDLSVAGTLGPDPSGLQVEGGLTPSVASPEQRAGQPAQPADDAWALGLLVREVAPRMPARVSALVEQLLDDDPRARPTAEAARDVLRRAAHEAAVSLVPPPRAVAARVAPIPARVGSAAEAPRVSAAGAAGAAPWRARLGPGALAVLVLASGALAARLWTSSTPVPEATVAPVAGAARPIAPGAVASAVASAPGAAMPAADSRSAGPAPTTPRPSPERPPDDGAAAGDAWAAAMGEALAAADRRAWPEAEAALQRAAVARPGAPEAADLAARLAEGRRGDEIARLRQAAAAAAAAEDWRAAANACEEALKLDPALAFALQGLARARARQQVADAIERHLARPDRLAVEAVAQEAELALDRARESSPGPRLAARVAALERALALAGATVTVRLVSDRLTQVTVLRVGPQGAFAEKALALRPGTWTVVGTRAGYRDVRQTVVVAPGRELPPVVVRCEEPL